MFPHAEGSFSAHGQTGYLPFSDGEGLSTNRFHVELATLFPGQNGFRGGDGEGTVSTFGYGLLSLPGLALVDRAFAPPHGQGLPVRLEGDGAPVHWAGALSFQVPGPIFWARA